VEEINVRSYKPESPVGENSNTITRMRKGVMLKKGKRKNTPKAPFQGVTKRRKKRKGGEVTFPNNYEVLPVRLGNKGAGQGRKIVRRRGSNRGKVTRN